MELTGYWFVLAAAAACAAAQLHGTWEYEKRANATSRCRRKGYKAVEARVLKEEPRMMERVVNEAALAWDGKVMRAVVEEEVVVRTVEVVFGLVCQDDPPEASS